MEPSIWESTSNRTATCRRYLILPTLLRPASMWLLSRPRCIVAMLVLLFSTPFSISRADTQQGTGRRFGYVSVTTVRAGIRIDEPGTFAGGVVVRFHAQTMPHDSLVLTDEHGTAIVPLYAGNYCAEAYGTDGSRLELDTRNRSAGSACLQVKANETVEFSLTLAPGSKYANTIPSLGVR